MKLYIKVPRKILGPGKTDEASKNNKLTKQKLYLLILAKL